MKTAIRITRLQVEQQDYTHFLRNYGEEGLVTRARGPAAMGTFSVTVRGYSEYVSETIMHPEVRAYLRGLQERWPGILYFGDLETAAMQFFVFGQLEKTHTVMREGEDECKILVEFDELALWLHHAMPHVLRLGVEAGLGMNVVAERMFRVLDYFHCNPRDLARLLEGRLRREERPGL
jgi:hypothetical protein